MKALTLALGVVQTIAIVAAAGCKSPSPGRVGYGVSVRHAQEIKDITVIKAYAQYTVVEQAHKLKFDFELKCAADRGTILMMLSPWEGEQVLIDEIPVEGLSKTPEGLLKASFVVDCKRGDHARTQWYDLYHRYKKTVSSNEVLSARDSICALQVQVVEDSGPK
jgi:hypothetical protein